ncbi:hypothetical protein UY3_08451 [Chelonia mydas]|uniref:Uncharacterized protein n=1 Tax=Chelonia mydas TaxID=8469 RepID=M7BB76_CHEMY|nr:hypothetical protein UY3_08451 [Chelonia mydas]
MFAFRELQTVAAAAGMRRKVDNLSDAAFQSYETDEGSNFVRLGKHRTASSMILAPSGHVSVVQRGPTDLFSMLHSGAWQQSHKSSSANVCRTQGTSTRLLLNGEILIRRCD